MTTTTTARKVATTITATALAVLVSGCMRFPVPRVPTPVAPVVPVEVPFDAPQAPGPTGWSTCTEEWYIVVGYPCIPTPAPQADGPVQSSTDPFAP